MADIYFWRQWFVLIAALLYALSVGFMLGFPAVLNQSLMSSNSTDLQTTSDHASWIVAINGVGGVVGSFTLPLILQFLGRKAAHISINLNLLVGWVIFYFATNIPTLYIARFIQGLGLGYVNIVIISEYAHPSRRGYFITMIKVTIALGTLCCHGMGPFWSWRQIALWAAIPALLSAILTSFWPESPSHLAMKSKYTECEESFVWLNGNFEESRQRLRLLLETQRKKNQDRKTNKSGISVLLNKIKMRDFQKSFLIVSVLTLALDLCGRYYFVAYVIQIMMELLGNKTSALYLTLGSDLLTLVALSSSSIIIRYYKRRTLLAYFGTFTSLLMLLISVLVYLKSIFIFSTYLLWFTALVIIFQSFIANVGLIPVSFAVIGEIFPLEHKSLGVCASGLAFTSLYALILKITPMLMERTNLYGTYAIYGLALAICLIVLYKIVPETKDIPLEEIEEGLNGVRTDLAEHNRLMSS